jgi:hypothetical protein
MQRPAPGGKVRSPHAETETISGILTFIVVSPGLPELLWGTCFWSPLLT